MYQRYANTVLSVAECVYACVPLNREFLIDTYCMYQRYANTVLSVAECVYACVPLNREFLIEMSSLTASNTTSASATADERRPSATTLPCDRGATTVLVNKDQCFCVQTLTIQLGLQVGKLSSKIIIMLDNLDVLLQVKQYYVLHVT